MISHDPRLRLAIVVGLLATSAGAASAQPPRSAPPASDSAAVFTQVVDLLLSAQRDTLRLVRVPDAPWARAAAAGLRARSAVASPDAYALVLDAPRFVGDIVLVRVHRTDYLHLVKAVDRGRFLIGNNRGGVNGWVGRQALYGRAIQIDG